jgi:hypothetical protein
MTQLKSIIPRESTYPSHDETSNYDIILVVANEGTLVECSQLGGIMPLTWATLSHIQYTCKLPTGIAFHGSAFAATAPPLITLIKKLFHHSAHVSGNGRGGGESG